MRKLMLLAGVAALGLATPVLADKGGRGGGQGKGHGGSAQVDRHGGQGKGHGRSAQADHPGGGKANRGQGRGQGRDARVVDRRDDNRGRGRMNAQERRAERAIQDERRAVREARRGDDRRFDANRHDLRDDRRIREARIHDNRDWRGWSERPFVWRDDFDDNRGRRLGFHCPPGLARQNAYCMPPGQLRHLRRSQLIGQRLPLVDLGYNIPLRYRYRFADNDRFIFRYGNDWTVYRLDRATGLVSSVIPLFATGMFVGEPMPLGYEVYNVPFAYRNYYVDSGDYLYRFNNNAIYRVNAETMLVDGIVALLTGGRGGLGGLGVGDRLPLGYDVYNVPFAYRDNYYDSDDMIYRYADGSIYRVDPTTRLIEAVISLLV